MWMDVQLLQLLQTHVMLRPPAEAHSHNALVFKVHCHMYLSVWMRTHIIQLG